MPEKHLEVIEITLGIDIADEIKKKTEGMARIELNLSRIQVKNEDKGPNWLEKCALVAQKFVSTNSELTKEEICAIVDIRDTQLPALTGKLRNYLRTEHKLELQKSKTGYFTRPIEQRHQTSELQSQ